MAHKKAGGSTSLGRDSISKRLGVKISHGGIAKSGAIIVRQRGTKIHAGKNVREGKDNTLFSTETGMVQFISRKVRKYDGKLILTKFATVIPEKK